METKFKELTEKQNNVLDFIKKNWQEALANPDSLKIDQYKSRFSEENFNKIKKLIIFYRNKYAKYLI